MKSNVFKICLALVVTLGLTACDSSPEAVAERKLEQSEFRESIKNFNKQSIENPVVVGTTKSGNDISVVHVKYTCETCNAKYPDNHYIYFANGTTSDNYEYRSGKTTRNKVEVVLKENPTPEQVIAEGERIKKEIEDSERKELKRLSHKYNYDECGKSMPEFVLHENPTIEQKTYSLAYEQAQKTRETCIHEHEEYEKAKKDLEFEKSKLAKEPQNGNNSNR